MTNENGGGGDLDREIKTCAVLGGRGFIGRALVERLLRLGNWTVRVVDAAKSPELEPSESLLADALSSGRAVYFQVDVRDQSRIVEAIEGVSVVFYTESMDSLPPDFCFCYNVIVQGAKNVVNACQECKVKQLIYNSSADVVFDNVHDIRGGDESLPYSGQFWDMVTDLRTQAEALILFANDVDGLLTCALRPCNVFGPGDKQLLPLLMNMAKSNWAKLGFLCYFVARQLFNCNIFHATLATHIYLVASCILLIEIENVAHAHICAEESLSSQMVTVPGKVFFITNLEPMKFWDFASLLLEGLGYLRSLVVINYLSCASEKRGRGRRDGVSVIVRASELRNIRPVISLPAWVVRCIVYLIKLLHVKSDSRKLDDLCASVYNIARLASHTRTFSCSAAQNHIQYSPVVSMEEAVKLTVDSFSHLTVDSSFTRYKDSDEPSKVEKLLGGGKVADILLWRDEKKTFSSFLVLALMYYWFFLSGGAFISSVATLLLLIIVLLCGHHILPLIGYGSRIPRISSSCFEISEVDMRNSFFTMKWMLDKLDFLIKSLAQGEDWSIFLKVIVPQYLTAAVGLALVLSFALCYVYEQYEEKVDGIARVAYSITTKAMMLFARKLPMPLSSVFSRCIISADDGSNQHVCFDNRQ
ncbi:3beta-hydroxysteroid-dehydrogenase/ decarboxylase isoform 3 [Phtheirospermum japonicum]|uniref:Reticulon-like protein n=1 Tax=Phtheirospermum japonicum TaxID=374723 RepID=A0A830CL28_9LAMI|nr:3beta-hydroxysteroid-dehydrogenase/ decarboxylase isoform 3 [Phtheirospermum japonicum]